MNDIKNRDIFKLIFTQMHFPNLPMFDYAASEADNMIIRLLNPKAVYDFFLNNLLYFFFRKSEIKERNKELDSLLKKFEELNNKINEMASSKGYNVDHDPIRNLIRGKFF